jgi:hypothetical protein
MYRKTPMQTSQVSVTTNKLNYKPHANLVSVEHDDNRNTNTFTFFFPVKEKDGKYTFHIKQLTRRLDTPSDD